jgi:DNA-binding response OmpR family regulator
VSAGRWSCAEKSVLDRGSQNDFYLIPEFQKIISKVKVLWENHAWFRTGTKLEDLSQFYEVAKKFADGRRGEECNIRIGDVTISTRTYSILVGTKEISLGPVGSALFNLMVLHAGEVVSRKQLSRSVIGKDIASANLNVHISDLRKKLGAKFLTRLKTVRGFGYRYASGTNHSQ